MITAPVNQPALPFRMIGSLVALVLTLHGCATMQLPDYQAQSIERYQTLQIQDGLAVAIHPLTRKEETKQYFGTDLSAANIPAEFVMAENRNTTSSYLVAKDQFALQTGEASAGQDTRLQQHGSETTAVAGMAVMAAGVIVTPLLIAALPIMFAGMKQISDADVIKHNFATKELRTSTLSPGEMIQGFVYFKLPEEEVATQQWHIRLQVRDLRNQEAKHFDFNLDLSEWQGGKK
jgi:hypothetical protein